MFDLCVVGGGMSGMTAAITAARLGSKVLLIEKNNKLGKKIYATGNGKCNLGKQVSLESQGVFRIRRNPAVANE